MKADIKERWIAALESGEYAQGMGDLHIRGYDIPGMGAPGPDRFCCAGVLCHMAAQDGAVEMDEGEGGLSISYDGESKYLPDSVVRWAGLSYEGQRLHQDSLIEENRLVLNGGHLGDGDALSLVGMNDRREPFATIAATIRDQVVGV